MNPLIAELQKKITDPDTWALVLRLILELTDGGTRLSPPLRLEIQAQLHELTGGAL